MGYRRMNITLPEPLAKKLDKLDNKSAFIARAVVERLEALRKAEFRRRLIQGYKEAANDPAERRLTRELDGAAGGILENDDW
ncbi:MAG: hypothetical protein KGJ84_13200 [Elusimicrobia bacterium]|nr:hypothetical protein [Elusimicrobiota bacterium]